MKIYRYWAKAEADQQPPDAYVCSYGCSHESIEAALEEARARANRIADTVRRGQTPDSYAYGDRPVREEVVQELQHEGRVAAVITRNAYGSCVLNAPRVLFADLDYPPEESSIGSWFGSLFGQKKPSRDEQIIARIQQVVERDRRLGLRVYRTSNGFRCLATTQTFDPLSGESARLLEQLESDPQYVKLCRIQECYRARISPKPWRMGIDKPPARFPFQDAPTERRYRDWQANYEKTARLFATCALIGDFGSPHVHPEVDAIQRLHDHFACPAELPLG